MSLRSLIMIILSTIILGQIDTFAAGPVIHTTPPLGYTNLCSLASRGTSTQTRESLYNLNALQKAYITKIDPSINFTAIITGASSRHHNKQGIASNPNCSLTATIGAREANETAQWGQFWSKNTQSYNSLFNTDPSYNTNEISTIQAANLQSYIDRSCGFDLKEDGKIGVKTLNAPFICTPPCQGKCGWQTFASLKDNLFYDEAGTKKVHDGSIFTDQGDPTSVMYIDGSKLTTIPDGFDPYLMLSGGKVVAKDTGSVADMIAKKGLGLTTATLAIEEDICPLEEEEKPVVNGLDIGMSATPLIVSAGLACYINNFIDKDGNILSSDQVKTKIKDGLRDSNSTIDPASIDKLKNKDGAVSGSSPESAGGCSLQGDGAITVNGACQCAPNYKRVWTLDGGEKCEVCDPVKCNCGLKLNTNMPFIGRCIRYGNTNTIGDASIIGTGEGADQTIVVNQLNAFPVLVSGLIKILMVLLGLLNFFMLIIGGVQMTIEGSYDDGWKKVQGVAILLAVFGALGVVLYLINPNFFT